MLAALLPAAPAGAGPEEDRALDVEGLVALELRGPAEAPATVALVGLSAPGEPVALGQGVVVGRTDDACLVLTADGVLGDTARATCQYDGPARNPVPWTGRVSRPAPRLLLLAFPPAGGSCPPPVPLPERAAGPPAGPVRVLPAPLYGIAPVPRPASVAGTEATGGMTTAIVRVETDPLSLVLAGAAVLDREGRLAGVLGAPAAGDEGAFRLVPVPGADVLATPPAPAKSLRGMTRDVPRFHPVKRKGRPWSLAAYWGDGRWLPAPATSRGRWELEAARMATAVPIEAVTRKGGKKKRRGKDSPPAPLDLLLASDSCVYQACVFDPAAARVSTLCRAVRRDLPPFLRAIPRSGPLSSIWSELDRLGRALERMTPVRGHGLADLHVRERGHGPARELQRGAGGKLALALADLAREQLPRDPRILGRLGVLHLAWGSLGRAETAFRAAAAADPRKPAWLLDLGAQAILEHRYRDALAPLRRAVHVDPADRDARLDLALACSAVGLQEEALLSIEQALARAPEDAFLRGVRGLVLVFEERWTEAVRALEPIVERARWPGFAGALLIAHLATREEPPALPRGKEGSPLDWMPGHLGLAARLAAAGRADAAARLLHDVIFLDPDGEPFRAALERAERLAGSGEGRPGGAPGPVPPASGR